MHGKKESQFAEIVWKSKDKPKEEKKKGWSLTRRSGSCCRQSLLSSKGVDRRKMDQQEQLFHERRV